MNNDFKNEFLFCDAPLASIARYMQRRDGFFPDEFSRAMDIKLLEGKPPEINLIDLVDEKMAKDVRESLKFLRVKGYPALRANITSDGGFVRSGMGIHDQFCLYGMVTGVVCEYVSSAAIQLILQGCMYRQATENTQFFCHYSQGYIPINARVLKKDKARLLLVKQFEQIDDLMVRILIARTKKSEMEVRKMLTRERVMYADEALHFGLIDAIVDLHPDDVPVKTPRRVKPKTETEAE
jgi:ATP-dependent protease ClpP protease subunit